MLEEAEEVWVEDLRTAVVGSYDVQQPPASLAAVPENTYMLGHIAGSHSTWLKDVPMMQDWPIRIQI
jgi:hypothetical protein